MGNDVKDGLLFVRDYLLALNSSDDDTSRETWRKAIDAVDAARVALARPASGDIAGALDDIEKAARAIYAEWTADPDRRFEELAPHMQEQLRIYARTALASLSGRGEVDSDGRRKGHSKLVYNKATRTIDKVDPHPPAAPDGWKK